MPKKSKVKYIKALFTIPDPIYLEFKEKVPAGQRSQVVTKIMKEFVESEKKVRNVDSFWEEVGKHIKGDYSHEDPVKLAKTAWDHVD